MKKIVNSLKELDNHEFIFENTLFKLCYNKNDRMLDLKIRYLDKYWAILYQNITARNIHKLREFNLEIELPITLTSKERHIVEGIKHLGNYFCRDRCGNLWAVSSEPILDLKDGKWKLKFNDTSCMRLEEDLFPFIIWETAKAWRDEELLELEVID